MFLVKQEDITHDDFVCIAASGLYWPSSAMRDYVEGGSVGKRLWQKMLHHCDVTQSHVSSLRRNTIQQLQCDGE